MNPVSMAVIGLRGMGKVHVNSIVQSPRAELVAVADTNAALATEVAQTHQVRSYTDYHHLLEREQLDAVVVATPHWLHAPMALDIMEAGLHAFVEKPIAIRVSEADHMVRTARENDLVLAVGHNYRTFPGNVKLKEIIDSGRIGPIYRILWQWLENRPEAYYQRDIWRCTWKHAGGGVLMNQTSHDLDLLCWLAGAPTEVSAMVGNWAHQHEVEDTAIASIRFASGAYANIQLSTCSHCLNYRQIFGENGGILFQDERNANVQTPQIFRLGLYGESIRQTIQHNSTTTGMPELEWQDVDCADSTSPTLLDSFIAAILDGGEPITDGVTARCTLELINAIILAGTRKKVVSLPLDRDEYDELMDELISGRTTLQRGH